MNATLEAHRHPDDPKMSTVPAHIEGVTQDYLQVLNRNIELFKRARHAANVLEGKRSQVLLIPRPQVSECIPAPGDSGTSPTQSSLGSTSSGFIVERDPLSVTLSPREQRPVLVDPYHHCEIEDIVAGDFILLDDNSDLGVESDDHDEDEVWCAPTRNWLINEPSERIGLAVIVSLVPIIGPVICFFMSYQMVYRPLKELKLGHDNHEILKCLGLFFPIVGPIYGRILQTDQRAVNYACVQVHDHVRRCNKAYKSHIDSYKKEHSFMVSGIIEKVLEKAVQDLVEKSKLDQDSGAPSSSTRPPPALRPIIHDQHQEGLDTSDTVHVPMISHSPSYSEYPIERFIPVGWWDHDDELDDLEFDIDMELETWQEEKTHDGKDVATLPSDEISAAAAIMSAYQQRHEVHQAVLNEQPYCESSDIELDDLPLGLWYCNQGNPTVSSNMSGVVVPTQAFAAGKDRSEELETSSVLTQELGSEQGIGYQEPLTTSAEAALPDTSTQSESSNSSELVVQLIPSAESIPCDSSAVSVHHDSSAMDLDTYPDTTIVHPSPSLELAQPIPRRPFVLFPFGPIDFSREYRERNIDAAIALVSLNDLDSPDLNGDRIASAMPLASMPTPLIELGSSNHRQASVPSLRGFLKYKKHAAISASNSNCLKRPSLRRMNATWNVLTLDLSTHMLQSYASGSSAQVGNQEQPGRMATEIFRRGDTIPSPPSRPSRPLTRHRGYVHHQRPPRTEMNIREVYYNGREISSAYSDTLPVIQEEVQTSITQAQVPNTVHVVEQHHLTPESRVATRLYDNQYEMLLQRTPFTMNRSLNMVVVPHSEISPLFSASSMGLSSASPMPIGYATEASPAIARAPEAAPLTAYTPAPALVNAPTVTPAPIHRAAHGIVHRPMPTHIRPAPIRSTQLIRGPRSVFANAGLGYFDSDNDDDSVTDNNTVTQDSNGNDDQTTSEDDSGDSDSQQGPSGHDIQLAATQYHAQIHGVYREYGSQESIGSEIEFQSHPHVRASTPERGALRVVNEDIPVGSDSTLPSFNNQRSSNRIQNVANRWQSQHVRQQEPTLVMARDDPPPYSSIVAHVPFITPNFVGEGQVATSLMSVMVMSSIRNGEQINDVNWVGDTAVSSGPSQVQLMNHQQGQARFLTPAPLGYAVPANNHNGIYQAPPVASEQSYQGQVHTSAPVLEEAPNVGEGEEVGNAVDEVANAFSMAQMYQNDPLALLNSLQSPGQQLLIAQTLRHTGDPIRRSTLTAEERQNLFRLLRSQDDPDHDWNS
ncbi:hypothetical protein BGZ46_001436 [Entomortierella lignicola]|nr:hypothetical protein BGZ46_001436 [Entomortierella lignicola]